MAVRAIASVRRGGETEIGDGGVDRRHGQRVAESDLRAPAGRTRNAGNGTEPTREPRVASNATADATRGRSLPGLWTLLYTVNYYSKALLTAYFTRAGLVLFRPVV